MSKAQADEMRGVVDLGCIVVTVAMDPVRQRVQEETPASAARVVAVGGIPPPPIELMIREFCPMAIGVTNYENTFPDKPKPAWKPYPDFSKRGKLKGWQKNKRRK